MIGGYDRKNYDRFATKEIYLSFFGAHFNAILSYIDGLLPTEPDTHVANNKNMLIGDMRTQTCMMFQKFLTTSQCGRQTMTTKQNECACVCERENKRKRVRMKKESAPSTKLFNNNSNNCRYNAVALASEYIFFGQIQSTAMSNRKSETA